MVEARTGRFRRSAPLGPGDSDNDIALAATLKQAIRRHLSHLAASADSLRIERSDLHKKLRYQPRSPLIVFLLDTSDSMGEGVLTRMKAAKGAVLALLRQASLDRSRVALVAFGGEHARVVLPPTSSVSLARSMLAHLPAGGATPFAEGLLKTWQLLQSDRLKHRQSNPLVVVLSDGEANVPMADGQSAMAELFALAHAFRKEQIPTVIMDVVTDPGRPTCLPALAATLGANYVRVHQLRAAHVVRIIRQNRRT